jgi:predicted enzyme related to lactoylglutathione lyase
MTIRYQHSLAAGLLWIVASSNGFTVTNNQLSVRSTRAEQNVLSHNMAASSSEEKHPMATTSRLSHVMLKVPSVDKTVSYWTEKGGKVLVSREKEGAGINGSAQLNSAFVALGRAEQAKDGDDNDNDECFAFEFIATEKEKYNLGNIISYVGVSMLLQFQNNLLGPILGEKPLSEGDEPNGIHVKTSASAPGDLLARFALKSKDLAATQTFYESILGFDAKGADEKMLCLRYNTEFPGVPTMLIFDATDEDLVMGDCFDHLAIATTTSIDVQYKRIKESGGKIFMNPTEMFGKKVMGVIDPNGYKVVLAGDQ